MPVFDRAGSGSVEGSEFNAVVVAVEALQTADADLTLLALADADGGTAPHEIPATPSEQNITDALLAVFPTLFTQAEA